MTFEIVFAYVSVPAKKKVSDSLTICSSLFSKSGSFSIIDIKSPLSTSLGSFLIAARLF